MYKDLVAMSATLSTNSLPFILARGLPGNLPDDIRAGITHVIRLLLKLMEVSSPSS